MPRDRCLSSLRRVGGRVGPAALVQQAAAAAAKGGAPHLSAFRRLCTAQLIGGCECCPDGPPGAWLRLSERRLLLAGAGCGATHLSDRSLHLAAFKLFSSPTPVRPSAALRQQARRPPACCKLQIGALQELCSSDTGARARAPASSETRVVQSGASSASRAACRSGDRFWVLQVTVCGARRA